MPANSSV